MNRIDSFRGKYRFLSNFYPAPTAYEDVIYPTSEHAYQAAKHIPSARTLILHCETPDKARKLGNFCGGDTLPGWAERRIDVMRICLIDKFTRNPVLAQQLVATGDAELIEGNTWNDRFWGVCAGVGENHLGRLLMDVRRGLVLLGVKP